MLSTPKKACSSVSRRKGRALPADAVLTTDVGRLSDMVDAGVLAAVKSAKLEAAVPAQYRHPDGLWFAQTTRARHPVCQQGAGLSRAKF